MYVCIMRWHEAEDKLAFYLDCAGSGGTCQEIVIKTNSQIWRIGAQARKLC